MPHRDRICLQQAANNTSFKIIVGLYQNNPFFHQWGLLHLGAAYPGRSRITTGKFIGKPGLQFDGPAK